MNETTAPPRIYTDPSQSEITVNLIADLDTLESKLELMPEVTTEADAEIVSEYRAQFRAKHRDLDKERKNMTAGARDTISKLNGKYNIILERVARCTQLADNKLLPYMQERERQRREAENKRIAAERAEAAAEQERKDAIARAEQVAKESQDAEELQEAEAKVEEARAGLDALRRTPLPVATAKSVTGVLGSATGMRKNWRYKISNFADIPDEYLIPEEERLAKGKLNAIAKRDQEKAKVPGIEFYADDALTSRAGVRK